MLKVIQKGYLGSNPELKKSGDKDVVIFSVATPKQGKAGKGQPPVWLNWEAYGVTALNIMKYLRKGSGVLLEGSMRNASWVDEAGGRHTRDIWNVQSWEILSDPKPK